MSDEVKRDIWWATCVKAKLDKTIDIIQFQHYYLGSVISVKMKDGDNLINSEMRIIPASSNSSYLKWQFAEPPIKNPFKKIQKILKRHRIEKDMQQILSSFKDYTEKIENIYGFEIKNIQVRDTLLVVTKSILNEFPTTSYVYDQIRRLRQYISRQQAEERNFPMLYVQRTGEYHFEVTIGIPVNKFINGSQAIVMQRMIPGYILYAECAGGPSTIRKAFSEMENYMLDYQKASPASPFELLVTDRLKESDTLKWKTKLYYPIY
ncbi:MAG: hypothetical protein WKF97_19630 [Chitinophagaceae bacterium]